ncbi:MAG: serpin family protein [Thermoguttaceae bacterium]|jgi:serine protease inhibitor
MTSPTDPREELGMLAALLCDGEISPEEAARLEQLASQSEDARQYLLDYVQLHGELYCEHGGSARISAPPPRPLAERRPAIRWKKGRWKAVAWAAGIVAAAACLLVAILPLVRPGGDNRQLADHLAPSSVSSVVQLSKGSDNRPLVASRIEPTAPANGQNRLVNLAAGWRIEPTGEADLSVVRPDQVRLERGEILVESVALPHPAQVRPALSIETPAGVAKATGTKFFIGTHPLQPDQSGSQRTSMSSLTRVLVLSGVVTLLNAQGSVTGDANHLLTGETQEAPVDHAVAANGDFAFDLYAHLAGLHPNKNLFFSPYSMSSALAMVAEGARGKTAEEMGRVLRFPEAARHIGADAQLIPWNVALIHSGMAALNQRLSASQSPPKELLDKIGSLRTQLAAAEIRGKFLKLAGKREEFAVADKKAGDLDNELRDLRSKVNQYELRVANALWGDKNCPFKKAYLETINKYYHTGGLFSVDFQGDYPSAVRQVNTWVAEQTRGRIPRLMSPDAKPADPVALVATNAVYFKGAWLEIFDSGKTRPADFTTAAGKKTRVAMMLDAEMKSAGYAAFNRDGSFFETPEKHLPGAIREAILYPDEHGFAMIQMPYKGKELSMLVIAPRSVEGIAALEKMLTSERLAAWIGKLQQRTVTVFLPKFKLATEHDMKETLEAMGISLAFSRRADLGGMADVPLYVSMVLHKAFVEVNETGTEAAAATSGAAAGATFPPGMKPFTPVFRADKPFVFLIRDNRTGTILFLGRMMNPQE